MKWLLIAEPIWRIESHDESLLESFAILQLHGELLRGIRTWDLPDVHAEEMARWCIVILDKNRLIMREQTLAQPLGVRSIREGSHLHREFSHGGIGAGEQFDAHASRAAADHVERDSGGAGEIENAVADERAAVDYAHLYVAAIIQIRNAQDAAERQSAMRGYERVHVENFAVGRAPAVEWDSVP